MMINTKGTGMHGIWEIQKRCRAH